MNIIRIVSIFTFCSVIPGLLSANVRERQNPMNKKELVHGTSDNAYGYNSPPVHVPLPVESYEGYHPDTPDTDSGNTEDRYEFQPEEQGPEGPYEFQLEEPEPEEQKPEEPYEFQPEEQETEEPYEFLPEEQEPSPEESAEPDQSVQYEAPTKSTYFPSSSPTYSNEAQSSEYQPAVTDIPDEYEFVHPYVEEIEENPLEVFSFIKAFDQVVVLVGKFQHSLTNPLKELIHDETGQKGLVICKLCKTRVVLTQAVNKLLAEFHHWATLGTTLEESHCRQESKKSLEIFTKEANEVSRILAGIDILDIGEQPFGTFKQLESLLHSILVEFDAGTNQTYGQSHY